MTAGVVIDPKSLFLLQGQKGEPGDVPFVCAYVLFLPKQLYIYCCHRKKAVTCLSALCR